MKIKYYYITQMYLVDFRRAIRNWKLNHEKPIVHYHPAENYSDFSLVPFPNWRICHHYLTWTNKEGHWHGNGYHSSGLCTYATRKHNEQI